jgi:hypothetical protein
MCKVHRSVKDAFLSFFWGGVVVVVEGFQTGFLCIALAVLGLTL